MHCFSCIFQAMQIAEAGGLSALVEALRSGSRPVQEDAVVALWSLAAADDQIRVSGWRSGGDGWGGHGCLC